MTHVNFNTGGVYPTACINCRKGDHDRCTISLWVEESKEARFDEDLWIPPKPKCSCTCPKLDELEEQRAEAVVQELPETPVVEEGTGNVRVELSTRVVEDVVLRVRKDVERGRPWLEEVAKGLHELITTLGLEIQQSVYNRWQDVSLYDPKTGEEVGL